MTGRPVSTDHLDELATAMAALTRSLETDEFEPDILDTICAEAVRAVPGADMASITAIQDGKADTAAFTDERALELDRGQYAAGEGPCLHAAAAGETVRLSIHTARERWPGFARAARDVGVGSYLAAPLHIDDQLTGALNLFGFADHGFEDIDARLLSVYTAIVAFGLRTRHRYRLARTRADQLDEAMRSRAVIEQAKGMLMLIHRIDADQAMQRLVSESQNTNVKLREVARAFVARGSRPG
ncbi:GAF and ANTAR domain-containing protein [Amycolatopsis sp. FDAARGOS 1241]|uniref:GAF and ANTAR domain-containing protein n=1 Tax=Amycolatopsis sp. FDAARGOS 1241 TaxID=2778070 RepID=UPI00194FFCE4|nr:GAF and ANTAR domain-containing protein [Amycolatopsis sp. FDAARGOS 1241]QRP49728.1 GAF and ANTAR domain-containing protein [Amycolatopsis sp. FDAARGOS 1241]